MTRPTDATDALPWYRQFWPWFIFALPASVVVAGLATVIIANQHADDLVVDEYYKTGLAINRELEKRENAALLGIESTLTFTDNNVTVALTGPANPHTLLLRLSHPMEADKDFTVTLNRAPEGSYFGLLPQSIEPHWHWLLQNPADDQWRLDGVLRSTHFRAHTDR